MPSDDLRQLMLPLWGGNLARFYSIPPAALERLSRLELVTLRVELEGLLADCLRARRQIDIEKSALARGGFWHTVLVWGGLATSAGGFAASVAGSIAD